MIKINNKKLIVLLGALSVLVSFSIDIYLPAMPGLMNYFHASPTQVQASLSIFIIGYAVSQLVYGPLSDKFGRRPVLLVGLVIYVLATIACLFSNSILMLNISRFFQSFGACGAVVMAYTVVRDVFSQKELTKAYAMLTLVVGLGPAVAPIVGGILIRFFNWRSDFAFLLLMGVCLLVATWLILPETNQHKNPEAFHPKVLLKTYFGILTDRSYFPYMITAAAAFATLFSFISTASFLYIKIIGVPDSMFGFYFAFNAVAFMSGCYLAGYLSKNFSEKLVMFWGSLCVIIAGIVLCGLLLAFAPSRIIILLPAALATVGVGLLMPTSTSVIMQPFARKAGSAVALTGFWRFTFSALVGNLAVVFLTRSGMSLGLAILACGLVCLFGLALGKVLAPKKV
jgi:DHA1 family bicyclomycin/chloramphenicol resistance-like MFS transporter